jgi:cytochrome c-type biogenesis protein
MVADVSIFAALLAGLVSFLSPCVLPLVPPYLAYLAGASLERIADHEPKPRVRRETIASAMLFVAGFATVFVSLGAAASSVGTGLRRLQALLAGRFDAFNAATGEHLPAGLDPFNMIAGLVIVVMGLHFLGITPIRLLHREARLEMQKPVGWLGAYIMGFAFALGWTPCIGPILASILAVALSNATVAKGAGLLAMYSLGLGVPFIIAAFAVEPFAAFLARFRHHLVHFERVTGGLLVLTGVVFFFGLFTYFNNWMLEAFPALGQIG